MLQHVCTCICRCVLAAPNLTPAIGAVMITIQGWHCGTVASADVGMCKAGPGGMLEAFCLCPQVV